MWTLHPVTTLKFRFPQRILCFSSYRGPIAEWERAQ
jgi:hypothetical protein